VSSPPRDKQRPASMRSFEKAVTTVGKIARSAESDRPDELSIGPHPSAASA
jgi:hypothetical protein